MRKLMNAAGMGFWQMRRGNYAFWDGDGQALRPIRTVTDDEGSCRWGHHIGRIAHLAARNSPRA